LERLLRDLEGGFEDKRAAISRSERQERGGGKGNLQHGNVFALSSGGTIWW